MIAHQNSRFKIQNHRNSSANIAVKLPVFDNSNLTLTCSYWLVWSVMIFTYEAVLEQIERGTNRLHDY